MTCLVNHSQDIFVGFPVTHFSPTSRLVLYDPPLASNLFVTKYNNRMHYLQAFCCVDIVPRESKIMSLGTFIAINCSLGTKFNIYHFSNALIFSTEVYLLLSSNVPLAFLFSLVNESNSTVPAQHSAVALSLSNERSERRREL